MSVNNVNRFLNIEDSHLRVVSGNVYAQALNVGGITVGSAHGLQNVTNVSNTTNNTIEFTNTETSLVTSGDINMLHSSNNAAINLNSNVVTEFPRSKKLIKYPRVALTSASQDGYVVTSYEGTTSGAGNYNVFNGIKTGTDRWSPSGPAYTSGSWNNTQSNGATQDVNGNIWTGEWLQIQLPNKIALKMHIIQSRNTHTYRLPKKGVILGSNTNGTTWNLVDSWSGLISETEREVSIDSINYYDYYRLVSIELEAGDADAIRTDIQEWELFGLPEYDPDADGVDVKVASYPNVPNTDWLEVYYDAKDLADGAVTSVDDLTPSGTNDGTATNVTVSDGAFVFNGTSSLLEKTSLSIPGGDNPFTFSFWIKNDTFDASQYILRLGDNQTMYQNVNIYKTSSNQIVFTTWLLDFPINYTFTSNRWNHISLIYPGGGWAQSNLIVYVDGKRFNFGANRSSGGTGGNVMTLATSLTLRLGGFSSGNTHFDGSIANFRLFNRALTSDEVWQLYSYQKEYFGHGDLSMTLKAGRLNVRGDISCDGVVKPYTCAFSAYVPSGANSSTTGKFPANSVHFNIGNCYNTSTYEFTAPVHGIYHMSFSAFTNQAASTTSRIFARLNDVTVEQVGATIEDHGNSLSLTVQMNGGDIFHFNGGSSTPIYYFGAAGHNRFCGHLICAL